MNLSTSTHLIGQDLDDLLHKPGKSRELEQLVVNLTIQANGKINPDKVYTLKVEVSEGMR